ncbi:MAG: N-acetyl-gamma-glutamyl-phosphate reductase [Clostridia bacterium]
MTKVFIDGREGTTGLRIYDRLSAREDIELILLPEEERKNPEKRKMAINESDISFLCLPDAAALEAEQMVENPETVLIDTSTAHRTTPGWAYGFPELSEEHFQLVQQSKRIAVPGCHAGGFIALVYPLVKYGILPHSALLASYSITGYSGGGKKMIAEYEKTDRSALLDAPRQYGLAQQHKHLKEMQYITGLDSAPVFCPVVSDFYSGMEMTVPVFAEQLTKGAAIGTIREIYRNLYTGGIVSYAEDLADSGGSGMISAMGLSGKDAMRVGVCGNEERILLIALYDNLGKGASGAAVECMNLKMGADPKKGLNL